MSQPGTEDMTRALADALYGDLLDPREALAKLDAADVHVNGAPVARKRKKAPAEDGHSTVARGLVLGAAAESLGTFRAGQAAFRKAPAMSTVAKPVEQAATAAGKLKAVEGSPAMKGAEFGLQAANLGIGLVAARKLSQQAKKEKVGKAINGGARARNMAGNTPPPPSPPPRPGTARRSRYAGQHRGPNFVQRAQGKLRPVQQTMTDEQAARHTAALAHASVAGQRMVVGTALVGGALTGGLHVKHSMQRRAAAEQPVTKAFRPVASAAPLPGAPVPLVAGVRQSKAGGLGRGLGRNGHVLGGGPTPIAKPVVKSVTWVGEIAKVDEDQHLVFGWASVSKINGVDVTDRQGDRIAIEEVEKAAYDYVLNSRIGGAMHARITKADGGPVHAATLVESFVSTPEKLVKMGLAADALPHGQWIGLKVHDEAEWQKVKRREHTGLSLHGSGQRTEVAFA